MRPYLECVELLRELVFLHERGAPEGSVEEGLSEWESEAFPDMLERVEKGIRLSDKQRECVERAAVRCRITYEGAENVFSALPAEKQRQHAERAAAVRLPWEERPELKVLRPPGR